MNETVSKGQGASSSIVCPKNSIPKLGFIWKKIGKKLILTDYGRYGSQYSPKKSKEG